MTKAEIVNKIAKNSGLDKAAVLTIVDELMESIKGSLVSGEPVFLRGFGSFILKERAAKTARNITANTTLIVPAHNIPFFKASKEFKHQLAPELENKEA